MRLASEAMEELISAVEAGKSERLKAYLAMLGRFHRYSVGNILLIHFERPDATRVAGYRAWKRLGRQVRRGEKGIRIVAPVVVRQRKDVEGDEGEGENADEEIVAFKAAHVFDVAQTDGKSLPEFAKARGDPGQYAEKLKSLVASKGIKLAYSNLIGPAQGLSADGTIVLRTDMAPAEEFAVLLHELAHETLHQKEDAPQDKTVWETEAEAVAFAVCQAVGLDALDSACDYVQLYQGDRDTLLASLERIRQTAAEIIEGITEQDAARSEAGRIGQAVAQVAAV